MTTIAGIAASLWLSYNALTQQLPAVPTRRPQLTAGADAGLGAPPSLSPCVMARDGYWRGRIFGSEGVDVDWSGATLGCAGNARPNGRGLRLFFAGPPDAAGDRLVLVVGIASGIDDLAGHEHPASVTLIDESSSQFFHSQDERCFTRVRKLTRLPDPRSYRVEGDLYCAGAIAAITGTNSVTLGDMSYAGRLSLEAE